MFVGLKPPANGTHAAMIASAGQTQRVRCFNGDSDCLCMLDVAAPRGVIIVRALRRAATLVPSGKNIGRLRQDVYPWRLRHPIQPKGCVVALGEWTTRGARRFSIDAHVTRERAPPICELGVRA